MPEVEVGSKRKTKSKDYVGEAKISVVGDTRIRLLLQGKYGGELVGKGGENLAKLRTQHNVKIDMTSGRASDRVFTIDGEAEDCVNLAKKILGICPQAPFPVGQTAALEMNLLITTDVIGRIIGKGGEKLKQIRDQSSAKIKVYQECLPNSNERVVAIGGEAEEDIFCAILMILDVMKDAPRGSIAPYDPNNKPIEGVGFGMIGSGMAPATQQGYQVSGNGANESDPFQQMQTVSTLTVSNEMCGAIIGKGGNRISGIRGSSGAKIEFSESDKISNSDRIIIISGTQYQVNTAEQLMSQSMRNPMF